MVTPVTPIIQSPLVLLQQAVDVCVCYEDTKNVAPESAQQQLGRIRGLIMQALAGLGEPCADTVEQTRKALVYFYGMGYDEAKGLAHDHKPDVVSEREARDTAAVILNSALTYGIGADL